MSLDVVPFSPATVRVVVSDPLAIVREAFASLLDAAEGLSARGVGSLDPTEDPSVQDAAIALISADSEADVPWPIVKGWLRKGAPRVVILSLSDDPAFVGRVFLEGLHGYIHKRCPPPAFLDAIRQVRDGELVAVGVGAFSPAFPDPEAAGEVALTDREIQILQLAAADLTATQVASSLQISPRTVSTHLQNAYRKLGVQARLSAITEARKRGLIG